MLRALASRRQSRASQSGEVFHHNTRWIKEGKVSDGDIYPWLRSIQTQGFELTIVGSSPEAVRVCIEAWHAGFRPVLIMMEDKANSRHAAEVHRLMRELNWWHGGAGMFTYGPRTIVSEGSRCLVQLDHKGRAIDVSVCTDNGGLHTLAETWQLFKGPAIIVDNVGTVDVEDPVQRRSRNSGVDGQVAPDDRRSLFLRSIKQARSAVADPKFWEDRYDPERLPFWAVGYREIFPNLLLGLLQITAVVAVHRYSKNDLFWMLRALADAAVEVPCANGMVVLYFGTLGLHLQNDRPTLLSAGGGIAYWLANCVPMVPKFGHLYCSDFVGSSVALAAMTAAVVLFCKYKKHMEVTKSTLLWYCAVLAGSLGPWFGTISIMLIYLALLAWNSIVASVFLTFGFSGMETQLVKFMLICYNRFVWAPRILQPGRVPGDQKAALSQCILAIHTFTETGRLVSMLCGAIRAEDTTFLYTNAVAVSLGLVINVAGRTGWFGCLLVRAAPSRLKPRLQRMLCPSAVQGLHVDMKFAMGWPRFFFMGGLCLGRGCIHNKWRFTMAGQDPGVWCWNGIVLVTALMAFIGEVVEDWLVYVVVGRVPPPQWEVFGSAMVQRFDLPGRDDIYHPCHYIVPQSAFATPSADVTTIPSLKGSSVAGRISRASTKLVQDLAPTLSVNPNFKHARYISVMMLQASAGATIVMILTVMSVGLGHGNLIGFCRPTRLKSFTIILRNSVLWSDVCEAERFL